ncbi:beta-1,4-galactosyltransferase 4-like [Pelobates fuscus]|uniref:beta-1,4-galactosyltransferase 4-like n=1 Tax=Pelobates fuscus TaxID=191477 RepID=UPI002FE4F201
MGVHSALTCPFVKLRKILFMMVISVGMTLIYLVQNKETVIPSYRSHVNFWKGNKDTLRNIMTTPKLDVKICPAMSPHLKGAMKITFEPALTLEQVQSKNPSVKEGLYHPTTCQSQQKVAIIIPFRNRERHLVYLLNHLHPFLQRQQIEYGIYVVHQAGNEKFNRAKLMNVGYLEALKEMEWDCFIFHDVDLLPENDLNLYLCDTEPKQLVVGRNTTNYKVLLQKMTIVQPPLEIAKYTMIFHSRDKGNEVNNKRMQQLKSVSKVYKTDGLNSCFYKLLSIEHNPLYINITVDIGGPNSSPLRTSWAWS